MRVPLTALACLLALSGCGHRAAVQPEQTWAKAYDQTTCTEWAADMSPSQRHLAARDLLAAARRQQDRASAGPVADRYETAIGDTCAATTGETVGSVAVGVYVTRRDRYETDTTAAG